MKIKVLFLVSTLESGGPTNVIYNIIKHLDGELIEPAVLTLSPEPPKSRILDFMRIGVQVHQANLSRLASALFGGKAVQAMVKQIAPQIIHSHSLRPDLFSARHLRNYIRISTIHADLKTNYSNTYNSVLGSIMAKEQLRHINKLEGAVACSLSVYKLYSDLVKSLECIPNGVDTNVFRPLSKKEIEAERIAMNLPVDKPIFVSAGSLCSRKDPETVINGFLGSHRKDDAILLLIGSGVLENKLRLKFKDYKNVIFKGFISDVWSYMKVADYFLSASLSEGLPNTVMEAMACGLPVCLSNIPSHNEVLDITKMAGKSFACKDAHGLSIAINEIVAEDHSMLRAAALETITRRLNAKKMSSDYQRLYLRFARLNEKNVS